MRLSQPVRPGQLEQLAILASRTGEPMLYPLTRMQARREIRRLSAIRREQVQRLRAATGSRGSTT